MEVVALLHQGQIQQLRQYKYLSRCWECTRLNAVIRRNTYHCDGYAGTLNGCIFRLVLPLPTMAHLLRRWRGPAQVDSLAFLNHYHHPLRLLCDRLQHFSTSHITSFWRPQWEVLLYDCYYCALFNNSIVTVTLNFLQWFVKLLTPIITDSVLVCE